MLKQVVPGKLGLEVREDVTVAEMGNFRWFTVAAPGPSTQHHDFAHVDLRVNSLAEVTLTSLGARLVASRGV